MENFEIYHAYIESSDPDDYPFKDAGVFLNDYDLALTSLLKTWRTIKNHFDKTEQYNPYSYLVIDSWKYNGNSKLSNNRIYSEYSLDVNIENIGEK